MHPHHPQNLRAFVTLIIILGSITAIGPLTIDMYLPAFSEIAQHFNASESQVQLSLTTYFIGVAFSQIFYGPLVDRFGRRLPLFLGMLIFTIATVFCLFVKSIEQLILLRFFQALGACAGMVIPRTIVRDIFSPQDSARVFSHLMLVMGIAPIVAPLIGTMLLANFGWGAIFIFLLFFGIFCMIVTALAIPETRGASPDDKISHALRKYLGILRDRDFVVCALSGGLTMAGLFTYITGSPFVYIDFFGMTSKNYSLLFAGISVSFIAAAQINAKLLKKFSIEQLVGKFLLIPAIAGFALIIAGICDAEFGPLTLILFFFLSSVGAIVPSTSALALSNQSVHAGSASALLGTIQFGLATIASLLVNKLHDGTALPMSVVIGTCGILACLIYRIFKRNPANM